MSADLYDFHGKDGASHASSSDLSVSAELAIKDRPSKSRAKQVMLDSDAAKLLGKFLAALRARTGKSAEQIGTQLGFGRSSQVLRREKGDLGIPQDDIEKVAEALRVDPALLQLGVTMAFDAKRYNYLGEGMSMQFGARTKMTAEEFFRPEIDAISQDKSDTVWMGVRRSE